jgi:hypothetical protein
LLIPTEFAGVTLLVEAVSVPGSEPTSRREIMDRVQDMFVRAQNVIENIAITTAELKNSLARKSREPDHLEIEFGISFGAQGNQSGPPVDLRRVVAGVRFVIMVGFGDAAAGSAFI